MNGDEMPFHRGVGSFGFFVAVEMRIGLASPDDSQ